MFSCRTGLLLEYPTILLGLGLGLGFRLWLGLGLGVNGWQLAKMKKSIPDMSLP